jgi:hypothetical protein
LIWLIVFSVSPTSLRPARVFLISSLSHLSEGSGHVHLLFLAWRGWRPESPLWVGSARFWSHVSISTPNPQFQCSFTDPDSWGILLQHVLLFFMDLDPFLFLMVYL